MSVLTSIATIISFFRSIFRRIVHFVLITLLYGCVPLQTAEHLNEDLSEQLLRLKALCDKGLVVEDVCKEKQRQILGLSAPVDRTQPIESVSTHHQSARDSRGFLGIVVNYLVKDSTATQGKTASSSLVVKDVMKGGPAEQAGVRKGDLIVSLGTQTVADIWTLKKLETALSPGTKTTLTVTRESGDKRTLEITAIDRRHYPPARTYRSRLGFDINLPAGWNVAPVADYEALLDKVGKRVGDINNRDIIMKLVEKMALMIEVFSREQSSIKVINHQMKFPTTEGAASQTCIELDPRHNASKHKGWGRLHNCQLRTISSVVTFCQEQEKKDGSEALKHCWVKGPTENNTQLSLSFHPQSGTQDLDDLDKMIASIVWR